MHLYLEEHLDGYYFNLHKSYILNVLLLKFVTKINVFEVCRFIINIAYPEKKHEKN